VRTDAERIRREVTEALATATTAHGACRAAVDALGAGTGAMCAALLPVRDHLRLAAATGAWQVFSAVPPGRGVSGRVYRSGKTETLSSAREDPDYIPVGPQVALEVCAPILDLAGRPIGVLNVEWPHRVPVEAAETAVETTADLLGARMVELGGPPAESRSEKLLRHATALTAARTERELTAAAHDAALDVSGLSAAGLVLDQADGMQIAPPTAVPGALERRVRDHLAAMPSDGLRELVTLAHRHGSSYTLGEPDHRPPDVSASLVDAGVRTLVAVPVGPPTGGGVMLVADDRTLRPDPTVVNLMELLAAQAWLCVDRLRTLAILHRRANSDPLTGLRHQGPFSERIAVATPGRTALLAIDIDQFKAINDTYGHQEGDQVLVTVAHALQTALRRGDELYRLGGDEFVAVLDVTRDEEAVAIAERLADAARAIGRTVSIGVAVVRGDEPPGTTLRRADAALYGAKRDGRDGVRLASAAG
jgi:diguanylate cyclase (GGDEF)-like protein